MNSSFSKTPSIRFIPAGKDWANAYHFAEKFLETGEAHLILGPHVGDLGLQWLEQRLFLKRNVRLGATLYPWNTWIKDRAREVFISQKIAIRNIDPVRERELFRETSKLLVEAGHLPLLATLLKNESFFASILSSIKELHLAGLKNRDQLERAMELLGKHREAEYAELWILAAAFAARLQAANPRECDESDLLEAAVETNWDIPLYFLGFSDACLLEVELLQSLARRVPIFVAVHASEEAIQSTLKAKEQAEWSSSLLLVRNLATNFSGEISVGNTSHLESKDSVYVMAESQLESEELRAAATLARLVVERNEFERVCFLFEKNLFQSPAMESEFGAALGLDRKIFASTPESHPFGKFILQALALISEDYALGPALQYAELLSATRGENFWPELALKASRLGIRKGLREWKERSEMDAEIASFAKELERLHLLFPRKGTAIVFHEALQKFAELSQFANLAKLPLSLGSEREAHTILAAILRKSAHLGTSLRGDYSFADWLSELSLSLRAKPELLFEKLSDQFLLGNFGEWLPPLGEKTLLLVLGMNSSLEPVSRASFFLEENVRRKLSDYLLPTRLEAELEFLQYFRSLHSQSRILFSRAKENLLGAELTPTWVLSTVSLEKREWPQAIVSFEEANPVEAPGEVGVFHPDHYSASLINEYKKCAFLAFVGRVLKIEDKVQAPELDIRRLDEGSFAHRVLELFYREKKGRRATSEEERARLLQESVVLASSEMKTRYYMGNVGLFTLQVKRLERILRLYIAEEANFFTKNPEVEVLDCEWKFSLPIAGREFKGVVDRIDIDAHNGFFFVVDYKIGNTPKSKEVKELQDFQLFVYVDAVASRVELEPAAAYYGSIRDLSLNQGLIKKSLNLSKKKDAEEGKRYFSLRANSGALVEDQEFETLRESAREEISQIASRIESGSFPVAPLKPSDCSMCRVRPACRITEAEMVEYPAQQRITQENFLSLLEAPTPLTAAKEKRAVVFSDRQEEALSKEGALVFLEASAGTGKTTVLVEKVKRFLAKKVATGLTPFQAVERFTAITFSEKAAAELSERLSHLLIEEYGAEIAAQAQSQVSTIHGFCRRIINELPLQAGANPLAEMLDAKAATELQTQLFQELFLSNRPRVHELLEILNQEYGRSSVQSMLEVLVRSRSLVEEQAQRILDYANGRAPRPEKFILPELENLKTLSALLELFQLYCVSYDEVKFDQSKMDFSDLERLALKAMRTPEGAKLIRDSIDLLLVDEFQDTNSIQRSILEFVAKPNFANAFVVGDAKQSIYRFRDADVSVFQSLRREAHALGNLYELDTNYRSQARLVDFATEVSKAMFPAPDGGGPSFEANWAEVQAHKKPGSPVQLMEYSLSEEDNSAETRRKTEAALLVRQIQELILNGKKLDDITILFRKLSGNRDYFQALKEAAIPFRLGSSSAFYQQMIILDCLSLLRSLYASDNDLALLALLRSPWFALSDREIFSLREREGKNLWHKLDPTLFSKLFSWRRDTRVMCMSELLRAILRKHPAMATRHLRMQAEKFIRIVESLEEQNLSRFDLVELLSHWAGWESEDSAVREESLSEEATHGAVQIMTVHASKGLEFEVVILPDLDSASPPERGSLRFMPSVGAALVPQSEEEKDSDTIALLKEKNKEREEAESKRLLYVALTRAKSEQYIFLQKQAKRGGAWANILRALPASENFQRVDANQVKGNIAEKAPTALVNTGSDLPIFSKITPGVSSTSISEIAAYQFCGEFHRLKFVQKWDDLVVAQWPVPLEWTKKLKAAKRKLVKDDPERERVGLLLRKLEVERKERGIALHRVLERIKNTNFDRASARLWLEEAYFAQGAAEKREVLDELLNLDMQVLERFLSSEIGQKLFADSVEAFPEIPFVWSFASVKIHGAMDRLIRHSADHWTVVDYKSSILEESRERYEFQLAAYRSAIERKLREDGIDNPRVDAYLVSLLTADVIPVSGYTLETEKLVSEEIIRLQENYAITETGRNPRSRGITEKDSCFSCPYVLHCDVGSEFVLR